MELQTAISMIWHWKSEALALANSWLTRHLGWLIAFYPLSISSAEFYVFSSHLSGLRDYFVRPCPRHEARFPRRQSLPVVRVAKDF